MADKGAVDVFDADLFPQVVQIRKLPRIVEGDVGGVEKHLVAPIISREIFKFQHAGPKRDWPAFDVVVELGNDRAEPKRRGEQDQFVRDDR